MNPICKGCGKECVSSGFSTGYGIDNETGDHYCYECCGKRDREQMIRDGKTVLYLVRAAEGMPTGKFVYSSKVTNWPNTLSFNCGVRKGRHNIAGTRYDVWFKCNNENWYGVTYGENTEICRCRRLKNGSQ